MTSLRVRFGPSPHGAPHAGNIRAAVLNWLFARKHNGTLIVRLDDTNKGRYIPSSITLIEETLNWLGIDWDEGMSKGGQFGPYTQSERIDIYNYYISYLLSAGLAYRCNCSDERLSELKKSQLQSNQRVGYDGYCRNRKSNDISANEPHIIRFKTPESGITKFTDLVRGKFSCPNDMIDDFILIRSNGFPTYHFAVVIDDHLMQVSHAIRADNIIPSTFRHLLLYDAFGWKAPLHGHFPLVLGEDGHKLSKHNGSIPILAFRDLGYLPEVILNFIALLGQDMRQLEMGEIISHSKLINDFNIHSINSAACIFDQIKLKSINGYYIRKKPLSELATNLREYFNHNKISFDNKKIDAITPFIQSRLKTLQSAENLINFLLVKDLFCDISKLLEKDIQSDICIEYLSQVVEKLNDTVDWSDTNIEYRIRSIPTSIDTRTYMALLREAITGQTVSPPIFASIFVLGKEESIIRINNAIMSLGN